MHTVKTLHGSPEWARSNGFKRTYIYYESHRLYENGTITLEDRNKLLRLRDSDELTLNLLVALLEETSKNV